MCWNEYSYINPKTYTSKTDIAIDTVPTLGFGQPKKGDAIPRSNKSPESPWGVH